MTYSITPVDGSYSMNYVPSSGFPPTYRYIVISAWIELKSDHSGWQFLVDGYNVVQDARRGVTVWMTYPTDTPPRVLNVMVGDGNSHGGFQQFGFAGFNMNSIVAGTYYNVLISIDSVANIIQCYVNDSALSNVSPQTWLASTTMAEPTSGASGTFNGTIATLARNNFVGTNPCMADVFCGIPGSFFDLTISSNRRKFINADLTPVYLGANGEIPLGLTPQLYYSVSPLGAASDFLTNRGTVGGSFTNIGAGILCAAPTVQHFVTVADLWFDQTSGFVDLSVESNRRKFITIAGCTEDLGNDGSTPFGSTPPVYLTGSTFTNAGDGGTFNLITGLISNPDPAPCCSDTPPPPPADQTRFRNISGIASGQGESISDVGTEAAGKLTFSDGVFYWSETTGYEEVACPLVGGLIYFVGLSSDGTTITGQYQNSIGDQMFPFVWTHSGGLTTVSVPSPYTRGFSVGISSDGSTIAGYLIDDTNLNGFGQAKTVPFIWNGSMTILSDNGGYQVTMPALFSNDGTTLSGMSTDDNSSFTNWVWSSGPGYVTIPYPGGITSLVLNAISSDGNTVVGGTVAGFFEVDGFVWTRSGGLVDIGTLPGHANSILFDVSYDGSKAVGYSISGDQTIQHAILYESGVMTDLGSFGLNMFGNENTQGVTISGDGSTIGILGSVPEFSNVNQPILYQGGTLIDLATPEVILGVTVRTPDNWTFGYPQFFGGMNLDGTRWCGIANISGTYYPTVWYNNQTFTMW